MVEAGVEIRESDNGSCELSIKSLETLETWRKSKEFSLRIYREVLPVLPSEEKWNLNQQLRRSSLSIPANIAEGYGRFYYQDNIRFCYIARGSLEETLSHLVIANEMWPTKKAGFTRSEIEQMAIKNPAALLGVCCCISFHFEPHRITVSSG